VNIQELLHNPTLEPLPSNDNSPSVDFWRFVIWGKAR
jgi:hypothetical protein